MSYLLFVDESGVDARDSPYEVLAGIAVRDRQLWDLVCRVQEAELDHFGQRVTAGKLELKAKKLLKRKTFRLAGQLEPIPVAERRRLAASCLDKGHPPEGGEAMRVSRRELTALAQAKLAFTDRVLDICAEQRVRAFVTWVPTSAPRPAGNFLRKDYSYLFERFYYFLEDMGQGEHGLVVFDELERSRCHLLIDQMALYFLNTARGRQRAARVLPEPFFVHSEMTTAIQLADLVAYISCWAVRFGSMNGPVREELGPFAEKVTRLRYKAKRQLPEQPEFAIWSFKLIEDLRPRVEKGDETRKGNAV